MTDTIAIGDKVSFTDADDQRVFGIVIGTDHQFYIVSCSWGGVKAIAAKNITKECG